MIWSIDSIVLQSTNDVVHLGQTITFDDRMRIEIPCRSAAVWKNFRSLQGMLGSSCYMRTKFMKTCACNSGDIVHLSHGWLPSSASVSVLYGSIPPDRFRPQGQSISVTVPLLFLLHPLHWLFFLKIELKFWHVSCPFSRYTKFPRASPRLPYSEKCPIIPTHSLKSEISKPPFPPRNWDLKNFLKIQTFFFCWQEIWKK